MPGQDDWLWRHETADTPPVSKCNRLFPASGRDAADTVTDLAAVPGTVPDLPAVPTPPRWLWRWVCLPCYAAAAGGAAWVCWMGLFDTPDLVAALCAIGILAFVTVAAGAVFSCVVGE